jgi:four helix bundle protein
MATQSPIFVKTEAFMLWLFHHTGGFPKHERFRLAKRIDDALFDFHIAISQAVYKDHAAEHLRHADAHLQLLRTYLRLALELKYTHPDQFRYAAEQLEEIGRLLGGWMKKA